MLPQVNVAKLSVKAWWIIFIILQSSLVIAMISTFIISDWVTSRLNITLQFNHFNLFISILEGNISGCMIGFYRLEYSEGESDFCKAAPPNQKAVYEFFCQLFRSLNEGFIIYLLCELVSIFWIFLWGFIMIKYAKKIKWIYVSYCSTVCAFIFHWIAIVGWIMMTGPTFGTSCSSFISEGSEPIICAGTGPKLALIIMGIMLFTIVCYIFVVCKVYAQKDIWFTIAERIQMNYGIVRNSTPVNIRRLSHIPESLRSQNPIVNQDLDIQNFYNDEIDHISIPPAYESDNPMYKDPSRNHSQSEIIRIDESNFEELAPPIFPDDQGMYAGQSICLLCAINLMTEVDTRLLPCGHPFHKQCIFEYIIQKDNKICPKCNQKYS
jgi:Zinc finger, C3HC4 type (RING finger)